MNQKERKNNKIDSIIKMLKANQKGDIYCIALTKNEFDRIVKLLESVKDE